MSAQTTEEIRTAVGSMEEEDHPRCVWGGSSKCVRSINVRNVVKDSSVILRANVLTDLHSLRLWVRVGRGGRCDGRVVDGGAVQRLQRPARHEQSW